MARSHLGAYKPTAVGRIITGHVMGRSRMLSEGFSRLQMKSFASMQVVAQVILPLIPEFFCKARVFLSFLDLSSTQMLSPLQEDRRFSVNPGPRT